MRMRRRCCVSSNAARTNLATILIDADDAAAVARGRRRGALGRGLADAFCFTAAGPDARQLVLRAGVAVDAPRRPCRSPVTTRTARRASCRASMLGRIAGMCSGGPSRPSSPVAEYTAVNAQGSV